MRLVPYVCYTSHLGIESTIMTSFYERAGVSANNAFDMASGYRSPRTSAASHASLIAFSSLELSLTLSAPKFSSMRGILVVPGIYRAVSVR